MHSRGRTTRDRTVTDQAGRYHTSDSADASAPQQASETPDEWPGRARNDRRICFLLSSLRKSLGHKRPDTIANRALQALFARALDEQRERLATIVGTHHHG